MLFHNPWLPVCTVSPHLNFWYEVYILLVFYSCLSSYFGVWAVPPAFQSNSLCPTCLPSRDRPLEWIEPVLFLYFWSLSSQFQHHMFPLWSWPSDLQNYVEPSYPVSMSLHWTWIMALALTSTSQALSSSPESAVKFKMAVLNCCYCHFDLLTNQQVDTNISIPLTTVLLCILGRVCVSQAECFPSVWDWAVSWSARGSFAVGISVMWVAEILVSPRIVLEDYE